MKSLFRIGLDVRWGDLDAFGHANNTVFPRYIEEARVQWFRSLSGDWAGETAAPILAAIQLNFRRPIGWPQALQVELLCERLGNKSVTLAHRITDAQDDSVLFADGSTVLVWVNRSGETVALPDAVRGACVATG
jgi:acyl-CoA thioester hydrolase